MGTLFLLAGTGIVFVGLDWIRVDPSTIHAPRWVLVVAGLTFAAPGATTLYYGVRNALGGGASTSEGYPVAGWAAGMLIAAGFTAIAAWIAFGPGERTFSGSVGVGGIGAATSPSETVGRWVFGFAAVLCGLITLLGLTHGIRGILKSSGR